jgi:GNAT superfamily N-acetyltransferase
MATHGIQLLKRHRYALPWLVLKKSVARFMTFETLVLFNFTLAGNARPEQRDPPGLCVLRIDAQSPVFMRLCEKYPGKQFRERLAVSGRECFVAIRDGEVAGFAWVSCDAMYVDEIGCSLPIAADEVFIYDCFVDEAFRGQGIYPAMLHAVLAASAAKPGIRRAVIGAVSTNHASLRGIRKAGFRECKRVRYLQCGELRRWWGLDAEAASTTSVV